MNFYLVYFILKFEFFCSYCLCIFGVIFFVVDMYNIYRLENDFVFYYYIYNFLQKLYCFCFDYVDIESDEVVVKCYFWEYLVELGFNKEDFYENGKLYVLGKYIGIIWKDNGKSKSLM